MRRTLLAFVVLAALSTAPARAGWAPEPSPAPPPPVAPLVIEPGVTIAGVAVGGLGAGEAAAAVQASFDTPLRFAFNRKRWSARPAALGARAYVDGAVRRALHAGPAQKIDLAVHVRGALVRDYVAKLGKRFARPAKDATLRLRKFRPFVTEGKPGIRVRPRQAAKMIVRALVRHERGPLALAVEAVRPAVTKGSFGPVVVIRRESKHLYLYRGASFWKRFGVATGQAVYPTPLGQFSIVVMAQHPWWYPPDSDWAQGLEPVPPGPGNPLGTRWMGLSVSGVGIHGTPDAASIGYSASHGCIRMRIPDAEWLFGHVTIGTPVYIVSA